MKNPLKKFTIALTGEFGPGRSHEKMKDWIEANGGTLARQINNDVTHLVCSLKDWKKRPKIGQWTHSLLQTPSRSAEELGGLGESLPTSMPDTQYTPQHPDRNFVSSH